MSDKHLRIVDEMTGIEYDPLKPSVGVDTETKRDREASFDPDWLLKTLKTWEDNPTAFYMASMSKPRLVNNIMQTALERGFKAPLPDAKRELKLYPHQQRMIDKLKAMPDLWLYPHDPAYGLQMMMVGARPGRSTMVESLWRQVMSERMKLSVFDTPILPTGKNQIIIDSLGALKASKTFLSPTDQHCHQLQYDCDPLIIPGRLNPIVSGLIIYYGAQQ